MKRKAAVSGFTFMGILLALNYMPGIMPHLILCSVLLLFTVATFLMRKQFKDIPLVIISVSALIASLLYSAKYILFYAPMMQLDGQKAYITAEITDEPTEAADSIICVLSSKRAIINGKEYKLHGKITAFLPKDFKGREFDIIQGCFKFSAIKNKNSYDAVRQNRAKGIYLNANPQDKTKVIETGRKPLYYYAVAVRKYVRNAVSRNVLGEEAALTNGIVLGDTSDISQKTIDDFKNTGLSHALAVSGIHVTFLAGFLLMLFDFFKVRRRTAYFLSILSGIAVMAITGFTPSVMRAGVMSIIMFAGGIFFEEADPLNSIGLTLLILCGFNPFGAVDLGLILSVLSTTGIFLIAVPLNKRIEEKFNPKHFKKAAFEIIGAFTSTLGATLFTMPVILLSIGNVSLVSVPANILTVFPVSLCFMSGIITAVLSFFKPAAVLSGLITKLLAKYLLFITSCLGNLSFSSVFAGFGYIYIWFIFIALLMILYFCFKRREKPRVVIAFSLSIMVLCTGIMSDILLKKDLLEVEAVSVGNGDSIILYKSGHAAVIDCGGQTNAYKSTIQELKRHNIKKLDVLIISHLHEDHAGNADELIDNVNVDNVILPPYSDKNELRQNIETSALKRGAKVYTAYRDMSVGFGVDIKLSILTRHINQNVTDEDDFNNNSLVVYSKYKKFTCLFTGDIEKEAECKVIKLYKDKLDCDVLKIPHHGSCSSSSTDFLANVTPKAALISVGKNNYGQPSSEVIKRLLNIGAMIYNTEENGNIRVYSNGSEVFKISSDK